MAENEKLNETTPVKAETENAAEMNIAARRAVLEHEIGKYVRNGYRVVSQADTNAQLVKPKRVSCLAIVLMLLLSLLLVGLILLLIYFLWYATQKDEQVYLSVDEKGKVSATKRKG